ncbi:arrestin domain-containing protein 3-like [Alosa pseudoharengus]|uniref:arrestin domain-containing protein 3-like n=1 Tax=Alosa pseudoharengus TaxID=34774 RepID=UPI003F8AB044
MSGIKSLSVTYDAINETNTFSNGDYISGRVTLEVDKEIKVNSFLIKAKGKASVLWTQQCGQTTIVYHDKETLFKSEHFFIHEKKHKENDGFSLLQDQSEMYSDVVCPGCHVYPFSFHIPQQDMPSSFKGGAGKVVYFLEAKLTRSMRMSTKDKTKFTFLSKTDVHVPDMKESQFGTAGKKLRFLNYGNVSVNVNIDGMKYYPGTELKIMSEIQNNSSCAITPKYCLYQKQSFFAMKSRRVHTKDILKEKGEPIEPSTNQTVSKLLSIPSDAIPSILSNCKVLNVEYRLKVYLDIKYSRNPEIKFPLVIAAAPQNTAGAATSEALERTEPPPPYNAYSLYPTLPNPSGSSWA